MHPDVEKLLDLQAKDLALLEVDRQLDAVLAEEEAQVQQVQAAEADMEAARQSARDAARRRDELEAKIESYRKLQERRRQRIEFVRAAKEAASLMAELDLARSVLAKEESDWLRVAEGVSALESAAVEAERRLAETVVAMQPARAEIAERRAKLEAARAQALSLREDAALQVEKSLRQQYDRLRASRSSTVVVALDGPACGACYTTVPLNRRAQIRSGTRVDWCEACGAILYAADAE